MKHLVAEEAAHSDLRLSASLSRLEPADNRQQPFTRVVLSAARWPAHDPRIVGKGHPKPEIRARRDSRKTRLSNTDNRERQPLQIDHTADGGARTTELALPVPVTQDGNGRGRRSVIGRVIDLQGLPLTIV